MGLLCNALFREEASSIQAHYSTILLSRWLLLIALSREEESSIQAYHSAILLLR